MKVDCEILNSIHLDPGYALLSVQNCFTCMEMFNMLDVHRGDRLNDVQVQLLLRNITNISKYECEIIFNLLDIDHSGEIEFDEFYLVFCILIASKDSYEKEFIFRHSRSIFKLIDADGSGQISSDEFSHMGILFNFDLSAIKSIFNEFDVSGDKNLDFAEFRLFTMACIDEARAQAARSKVKAFANYHERLLNALEPLLRRFIRTDCLPVPKDIEETTVKVRQPYIPGKRDWRLPLRSRILRSRFNEKRQRIREWIMIKFGAFNCMFRCCWILCCDFCCLKNPEDKCKCSCKCRCVECWINCLRKTFGWCFACCHCCCNLPQVPNQRYGHYYRRKDNYGTKLDIKVKGKDHTVPKKKKGIFLLASAADEATAEKPAEETKPDKTGCSIM